MAESGICPKCSKPKVQALHGSITQWMSSCGCEIVEPTSNSTSVSLCKACGKRIEAGRSGSFTQWVFRSDKCECKIPEPIEAMAELASGSLHANQTAHSQSQDYDDELELALEPDTFPVDRYKALKEIGHGAAGQVFLCRDRLLRTKVAVKCLHHASAEQLMLFQDEARATSKLSHPNIIKVLNFGATETGAPYMVMEFLEGISLEQYITALGPLKAQQALMVIAQVADALSYTHSKGIFHRDIKSSNIILTGIEVERISVRIIDFGISMIKHANQEPTIVQGRTVAGTPAYMPPDQAFGKRYDERSEVYSVGCVFFEALAGSPPFDGDTALEIINKHARDTVPHISELNPNTDCPDEVESIVSICLEKEQADRYQTMADLRDACISVGKLLSTGEENFPYESSSTENLPEATTTTTTTTTTVSRHHRKSDKFLGVGAALITVLLLATVYVAANTTLLDGVLGIKQLNESVEKIEVPSSSKTVEAYVTQVSSKVHNVPPTLDTKLHINKQPPSSGNLKKANTDVRASAETNTRKGNPGLDILQVTEQLRFETGAIIVNNNNGAGEIDAWLKAKRSVLSVHLIQSTVTEGLLRKIKALQPPNLYVIDCDCGDADLKILSEIHSLEGLVLNGKNHFTKEGLKHLRKLPLKFIVIRDADLGNDEAQVISSYPYLLSATLSNNRRITSKGLAYFLGIERHMSLKVDGCACAFAPTGTLEALGRKHGKLIETMVDSEANSFADGYFESRSKSPLENSLNLR